MRRRRLRWVLSEIDPCKLREDGGTDKIFRRGSGAGERVEFFIAETVSGGGFF